MKTTNILLFPNNNKKGTHPVKSMGRYVFFANSKLLTNELIKTAINNFWSQKIEGNFFKGLSHVTILFKIVLSDGSTRSIGRLQFLKDESQLIDYIVYIQHLIAIKYNHYLNSPLEYIIFEYSIREGASPKNTIIKQLKVDNIDRIEVNHNHFKLPGFINPLDYGVLTVRSEDSKGNLVYAMQSSNGNLYRITSKLVDGLYHNKVEVFNKGVLGLTYEDIQKSEDSFIRKTDTRIYFYTLDKENNQWLSHFNYDVKPTKYIEAIKKHHKQDSKFITMDIETLPMPSDSGAGFDLVPILISYFDGIETKSFYISEYSDDVNSMFNACIDSLLNTKYIGYNIYLHNFSQFDSIYLFGHLYRYGKPNIIKNSNGNLISASVKTTTLDNPKESITLKFYDSLLLLNASLHKLSIAFDTDVKKGIFPFKFLDQANLDYEGLVPDIKYFGELSQMDYVNYVNRFNNSSWSFKLELIKYCEVDCISLHQVLTKFSDLIWTNFKINFTKYPTISSLAFAIFRSNFMNCSKIPQISNDFFLKIKPAYTGGSTDMFIPTNCNLQIDPKATTSDKMKLVAKSKMFSYDVNSLYPFVMANMFMPIGKIMSFQGDITKTEHADKLGYYLVEVTAPQYLEHPIIQSAINSSYAGQPVDAMASTLGTWKMIIYSEEMKNAIKFGYKFNVIAGIVFEDKEIIFYYYRWRELC